MRLAISLAFVVAITASSCSGPTTPTQRVDEPAAIISLDTASVLPGTVVSVALRIDYTDSGIDRFDSLGGFHFNIAFDDRALSFLGGIESGSSISEWEFFAYRYTGGVDHLIYYPAHLWIMAIREMNDGRPVDPPQKLPEGVLATIQFMATSDWRPADFTTTLYFDSGECGDNVLQPSTSLEHYYIALPSFDGDMTATIDTLTCRRRVSLEPALGFRGGSVRIITPVPDSGDSVNIGGL